MSTQDTWIAHRTPRRAARVRLFCFPYAGGGASLFRTWSDDLPPEIEVCPVQLPGREARMAEPLFDRLAPLVEAAADRLMPHLNRSFAFFGHSMGAMISFELARLLRSRGALSPLHLFASGCLPPHVPDPNPIHHLPDDGVVQNMRSFGGMSEDILQNEELMRVLLPLLRADSAVTETYVHSPGAPLRCPITAFGGHRDNVVPPGAIEGWSQHTSRGFSSELFDGDHFFLQSARGPLLQSVARRLLASLPGAR